MCGLVVYSPSYSFVALFIFLIFLPCRHTRFVDSFMPSMLEIQRFRQVHPQIPFDANVSTLDIGPFEAMEAL